MNILRNWNLNLTADHVLRSQGTDPDVIRDFKPKLYEIAEWAVREGTPLLDAKVIQKNYLVIRLIHQKLELHAHYEDKHQFLSGSLIADHLATADKVTVIVCTIGDTLERLAAEMMGTDPYLGWALDSFGSAAVESLATQACNQIETQIRAEAMESTIPISPGMIGWPVDLGQAELFKLVDPTQIGVSLSRNYQMQPCKTLSMVIGIGRKIMKHGRTCDYCAVKTTCQYQNHYV
jgi:hypothetical protein